MSQRTGTIYAMVMSPGAVRNGADPRGFQHAVVLGTDRTLCGHNCDEWLTEPGFARENVSCRRCRKALGLDPQ